MKRYRTLTEALAANASDALSVTFIEGSQNEVTVTYRELQLRALRLLHVLQSRGLKPGDELIFFLRSNENFIDAFWACLFGGIVPVPVAVGISDEHRSKVFRIFARLQRPRLLTDAKSLQLLEAFAEAGGAQREYSSVRAQSLVLEDLRLGDTLGEEHPLEEDALAFIQFSSGSTREPHGVCLTHRNVLTTVVDLGHRAQYRSGDVSLSWMPLTHDLGLIGFHINMIVFGINQHIMATELFSRRPLLWLQKASEKRASLLSSPNFGLRHYMKMYRTRDDHDLDLSCIRMVMNAAEPISVGLSHEFLDTLSKHGLPRSAIYTCYGLAEASLAVSLPKPGREFEYVVTDRNSLNLEQSVRYVSASHPDAVRFAIEGPPVEHCRVRIATTDGRDLGQDVIGEVQLQGANVTAGYYNDREATQELFTTDGWLHTGDLGFLHQGQVVITGRLKDIIFVNGQNFYPHDLEAVALLDERLEIGKVAVLGVRKNDADHDDVLVCVLFRGELSDFAPIVKHVRQLITKQTGVEVTHVLPVRRIPKTTSGKVQRRLLADDYLRGEFDQVIADIGRLVAPAVEPPAEAVAHDLAALLKSIFDRIVAEKNVGAQDDFFEIGMSSLELAQIHEQIDANYPGMLDITDLFDHSTIDALAEFLRDKLGQSASADPGSLAASGGRSDRGAAGR
ncbi:MAG: hypothetical protein A2W18_01975 [Candidatus Muproteobacteria bacterium RBG_16_60_9]|uniref:Carrier domain-containing protein n=1 Tax=Candidatus Muproteobacteria bacterium RBG_16_60_9 TaxID=1817755 RepID=A0A1F6UXJ8_9PROT|nr:MAG: hypothetical protein A2W18_01975 [Candidatus Muproteobacteria bacterium RBG_16_60_9]